MLNRDGIRKKQYGAPKQILANVSLQSSVGCIVPNDIGVDAGDGIKLVKAGTPINIDLMDMQLTVQKADGSVPMNAVLLHDVDVTKGNANGTALIFGFVNVNRVDDDVATAIETATANAAASKQLTFMKA